MLSRPGYPLDWYQNLRQSSHQERIAYDIFAVIDKSNSTWRAVHGSISPRLNASYHSIRLPRMARCVVPMTDKRCNFARNVDSARRVIAEYDPPADRRAPATPGRHGMPPEKRARCRKTPAIRRESWCPPRTVGETSQIGARGGGAAIARTGQTLEMF